MPTGWRKRRSRNTFTKSPISTSRRPETKNITPDKVAAGLRMSGAGTGLSRNFSFGFPPNNLFRVPSEGRYKKTHFESEIQRTDGARELAFCLSRLRLTATEERSADRVIARNTQGTTGCMHRNTRKQKHYMTSSHVNLDYTRYGMTYYKYILVRV